MPCQYAVFWGLSERVYADRHAKISKCYSESAQQELMLVPRRVRWEHPVLLKQFDCIRDVMAGR